MERNSENPEEFCEFDFSDVAATSSYTRKIAFGCGNLYLRMDEISLRPVRVFITVGKTGCCQRALLEAIGRLVSIMLERGDSLKRIVHTLIGIRCSQASMGSIRTTAEGKRQPVVSCVDALARELEEFILKEDTDGDISV